jgi:hypothetical protein
MRHFETRIRNSNLYVHLHHAACGVCGGQERHWCRFSPSTSVSPANHSTNFSIIIMTRGWHNRPIGGRNAERTQLDSTPHYTNFNQRAGPGI